MDDLKSVISAMHETENGSAYDPSGRFSYPAEQAIDLEQPHDDLVHKTLIVDKKCRARMLDWCIKMVDYFEIDRSIVFVAAWYQDRYLATEMGKSANLCRATFRTVTVTALYLAIKLRIPHRWNVTAQAFAQLCQGSVSGSEITEMESNILFALGWHVNPPLAMEYIEVYLDLIFNFKKSSMRRSSSCVLPSCVQEDASLRELKDRILELVQYQLHFSLHDKRLLQVRSSVIATASILNSLEGIMDENLTFDAGNGLGSFCQESIALTLNMMSSCNIASEKKLEDVRSALLSSVVPPKEGNEDIDHVRSALVRRCNIQNCTEPSVASPTPSSSPKSATSKFWSPTNVRMPKHVSSPRSVLSRVFALHYV